MLAQFVVKYDCSLVFQGKRQAFLLLARPGIMIYQFPMHIEASQSPIPRTSVARPVHGPLKHCTASTLRAAAHAAGPADGNGRRGFCVVCAALWHHHPAFGASEGPHVASLLYQYPEGTWAKHSTNAEASVILSAFERLGRQAPVCSDLGHGRPVPVRLGGGNMSAGPAYQTGVSFKLASGNTEPCVTLVNCRRPAGSSIL